MKKIFLKSPLFFILWVLRFKFNNIFIYYKRTIRSYLYGSGYYEPLKQQVTRLLKDYSTKRNELGQNILFATVNGNAEVNLAQELVLGITSKKRSKYIHTILRLILPSNSWNVIGNSKLPPYKNGTKFSKLKGDQLIKNSHNAILDIHGNAGFFVHELIDYSDKNDIENALIMVEKIGINLIQTYLTRE